MNTNAFIADLLEADWCLNGTSVEAGFDCVTLMNEVFSRFGIAIVLPLPGQYRFAVCETEALKKFFEQLEPCAPFPGSMVSMNKGGHGGVLVFDDFIIHAHRGGVVLQRRHRLMPRIDGFFKLRGT